MPSLKTKVELQFGGRCKRPPEGVHFAPGRAILAGSHLDAVGGRVLAAPLREGVACAWGIRPDSRVVVWGMNARQKDSFHHDRIFKCGRSWSDLARGACEFVAKDGRRMPGIDLMVLGDLPIGEGLASSAAYLTVILRSLHDAVDSYRSKWELAEDIPEIERAWLGRESSKLDAYLVAAAKPRDEVVVVDSAALEHERLTLPEDYEIASEDSGVPRPDDTALGTSRRRELIAAADGKEPDGSRATYLREETQRVDEAVTVLRNAEDSDDSRMAQLGRIMAASHRALSRDLEASTPEVDSLIALAMTKPSILGARLQGDGGGGRIAVLQKRTGDADAP